jgi:hypothetical protein
VPGTAGALCLNSWGLNSWGLNSWGLNCRGVEDVDKLGLACAVVPVDQVVAGPQPSIEELVQRDRAVREIGLGQARALLKQPEILLGLRDQGDRNVLARCVQLCEVTRLAGVHDDHLLGKCPG